MKLVINNHSELSEPEVEEFKRLFDFIQWREKLESSNSVVDLHFIDQNHYVPMDMLMIVSSVNNGRVDGATCREPSGNHRMFVVSAYDDRLLTFAHEMVHVADAVHGRLKDHDKGTIWDGELFSNSTPYRKRPWEAHAFAEAPVIMKEYSQWLIETGIESPQPFTPTSGSLISLDTLSLLNMLWRRFDENSKSKVTS